MTTFYIISALLTVILIGLLIFLGINIRKALLFRKTREKHRKSLMDIVAAGGYQITDHQGNTPLILALRYGFDEAIEPLLSGGANPNHQNEQGNTPLHFAAVTTKTDKSHIRRLVESGSQVDAVNQFGQSAFWIASAAGNETALNQLLQQGARINQADNNGNTPLMAAISTKAYSTISWLIEHDALVSQTNHAEQNALTFARENWKEYSAIDQVNPNQAKKHKAPLIALRKLSDKLLADTQVL